MRTLSYVPLAEKTFNRILEILKVFEGKNPLVGFHESKIHEIFKKRFDAL